MRALLALLLVGCGSEGFGVHLTLESCGGVGDDERDRVAELVFTVTGDESLTASRAIRGLACSERVRYLPLSSTRQLSIEVVARDQAMATLAQGASGRFTLRPRGFTDVEVRLASAGNPLDLAVPDDGGSSDGGGSDGGGLTDLARDAAAPDLEVPFCPNVMIVLDHTTSMTTPMPTGIPDGGSKPRDELQRAAVLALVKRHDGRVPLGLASYYGLTGACNQGITVHVPVARNTAAAIESALASIGGFDGGEFGNNGSAAAVFSQDTSLLAGGTPAYLLMLADSPPTCNGNTTAANLGVIEIAAARGRGVPTLIVGIDIASDPTLQAFANAGGVPCTNCGAVSYYPSQTGVDLDAALEKALRRVADVCK